MGTRSRTALPDLRKQLVRDTKTFIEAVARRYEALGMKGIVYAAQTTIQDLEAGRAVTVTQQALAQALAGTGDDIGSAQVERTHEGVWVVDPDGTYHPA